MREVERRESIAKLILTFSLGRFIRKCSMYSISTHHTSLNYSLRNELSTKIYFRREFSTIDGGNLILTNSSSVLCAHTYNKFPITHVKMLVVYCCCRSKFPYSDLICEYRPIPATPIIFRFNSYSSDWVSCISHQFVISMPPQISTNMPHISQGTTLARFHAQIKQADIRSNVTH